MNVPAATSSVNSELVPEVDFRLNILVIGLIAANYGNYAVGVRRPMDGWGNGWESYSIRWNGHAYTAGSARKGGKAGIRVTCRSEATREISFDKFIQWSDLDEVLMRIPAVDFL